MVHWWVAEKDRNEAVREAVKKHKAEIERLRANADYYARLAYDFWEGESIQEEHIDRWIRDGYIDPETHEWDYGEDDG